MKRAVGYGFSTFMRSCFAGRRVGKTPPNGDREFHPSRLTHFFPDLQQLMQNLHPCLLGSVLPEYRLTYACDMG